VDFAGADGEQMVEWRKPIKISIPENARKVKRACGEQSMEKIRMEWVEKLSPNFQVE
jgi:hypothetical protein